jgi:hypothetical protein
MRKFIKISAIPEFIEKYGEKSGIPIEQMQIATVADIYAYADARCWEINQIITFSANRGIEIVVVYYEP